MLGTRHIRVYISILAALCIGACVAGIWIFLKGSQRRGTSSQHVPANDPKAILAEANHYAFLSNSYRADPLYAKAEKMFRERGDKRDELYAKIGRLRAEAETMSFVKLSDFLESQLATPLVQKDPKLKLWCLSAKGMTDIEVNVPAAKKDWQEAELLASTLKERQWEARAQGELGLIAFLQGKSLKAGQLVGGALLSAIKSGDIGAEVRYLELIGNGLEVQGRSEDAQYFFSRAINVAKSCKDCGFPYMAYEGKGEALTAFGKTNEARTALTECLGTARREQRTGHEAQTLILLGKLSLQTGNTTEAIEEMEEAAAIAGKYNYYRMDADDLFDLAKIYEEHGDLAEAEKRLTAARDVSMRLGDRYSLPRDLTALARLEVRLGKSQEAERLYDEAEDVVDSVVLNAPGPYSGGSFVGEASDTYLGDFELTAQTNNVNRAFRALERARGRIIEDALEHRAPHEHTDSPAYARIEGAISRVQLQLMRSEDPHERQQLLENLEEQEQRLAYLNDVNLPRETLRLWQPPKLREVRDTLVPDEVILEYVLDEPRSFCLSISHDDVQITKLDAGRREIEDLTERYLEQVRALKPASDLARKLYSVLLSPVPSLAGKKHYVVVPDGKLYFLPFGALKDSSGQYVVKSVDVTYVPSASVLEVLKEQENNHPLTRAFLGVGDVVYSPPNSNSISGRILRGLYDLAGVHQLRNLPASKKEVINADRALGGTGSVVLLGPKATILKLETEPLGDFSVLHLAVHSIPSTEFPTRAALVLDRSPGSNQAGLLQEWQIIDLSLNADLVTLSACDTGVGKLEGEEGVTDLADAFLFAGAKSVVASLWESDDEYTAALMQQFYRHLAQHEDKDIALQQAKLDLIQEYGGDALPFYWAGFILEGEGSSPVTIP
ncbi:MAG: CHAT domain-containing protein [Acidobacteria bacterium]|nr:MAG: CHAT domain-containing protein [Acidobacteriota bacterium]